MFVWNDVRLFSFCLVKAFGPLEYFQFVWLTLKLEFSGRSHRRFLFIWLRSVKDVRRWPHQRRLLLEQHQIPISAPIYDNLKNLLNAFTHQSELLNSIFKWWNKNPGEALKNNRPKLQWIIQSASGTQRTLNPIKIQSNWNCHFIWNRIAY